MTYQQLVGNSLGAEDDRATGSTIIDLNTSASSNGVLSKAFGKCSGTGSINKIKIFRDDGTNYLFIGEVAFSPVAGTNTIYMDISILSGDLIGYYIPSTSNGIMHETGGSRVYRYGVDVTTNSLKSAWSPTTGITYLNAGYDDAEFFIKTTGNDLLSGLSWTNAWATVNKAATTVPDGSTVHIGFGTYNVEPVGNKIAPQNAGSSGIAYLPETATTGGGTGSVIVEKN